MRYNICKSVLILFFSILFGSAANTAALYSDGVDSLKAILPKATDRDSMDILTQLGRLEFNKENFRMALEYFYEAFKISGKLDDKINQATLTNNIAAVYYKTDDLDKALSYFIRSLELEKEFGNKVGVSKSLNNIAIIYNETGELEKSLEYYEETLALRDSLNDEEGKATVYNNMGLVFLKKKEYRKAISHYKQAEEIFKKADAKKSIANTQGNISRAYLFLKEYDEAIKYGESSLKLSGAAGSPSITLDSYRTLYTVHKEIGDHKNALKYLENYESAKDSLNRERIASQMEDIKIKYETEQRIKENEILKNEKEAQRAVIRNQKIIVVAILIILGLVSVLAYVLYKNSLIRKQSIELLEEQNEEMEKRRNELEKLNQLKNKIFSVISHEVRSPLNSLIGTVGLLTSGYLSPEEFFQLSTDLKQKVNQTSNFLNNILVWSKAQMKGISIVKEEFQIDKLINETLDLLKEQADIKGVEIERDFEKQQSIVADKNMIGIVTNNLISNAIKFSGKGKKVFLKTYKRENEVVVEIEDQGIGIPADIQAKVLGRDLVNSDGTPDEPSGGLGLIISRMLIEESGGKIWLESREGIGTKFSFSIPMN